MNYTNTLQKPKKTTSKNKFKINQVRTITRANRDMIVNINMFLLTNIELKDLFWSVKNVEYNPSTKLLNIEIDTMDNKLGTTLEKMRKNAKGLAQHLYSNGVTNNIPRVNFSVQKGESLLDKLTKMDYENNLKKEV